MPSHSNADKQVHNPPSSNTPDKHPLLRDIIFPKSAPKILDRKWLTSDHVNGWNVYLRRLVQDRKDPIKGLFNVDGAPDLKYCAIPPGSKFVQILHNGSRSGGHWTVAAGGYRFIPEGSIALYDSLECDWEGLTFYMQKLMASMLNSSSSNITVSLMPSSKQNSNGIRNYFDCGPYAFAFATALALDQNPSELEFHRNELRDHVRTCFADGAASAFPSTPAKRRSMRTKTFVFEIHCFCRLPTNGKEKMVRCDVCETWFHKDCLAKTGANMDIFSCKNPANVLWACPNCPSNIKQSVQQTRTVKPKTAKKIPLRS